MRFDAVTSAVIDDLERQTARDLADVEVLETAAQLFCDLLYGAFTESVVLVRVFATVPLSALPTPNRRFVVKLAGEEAQATLAPATPVLSLLGTRGQEPRWNSRHLSEGHVGIPLASAEYIEAIPMIASLVKQLGLPLPGGEDVDTGIVTQALGQVAGVFYVDEAGAAVDAQGRRIIAAQDFVREHGVRTVFGFGGAYALTGTFFVTVVFTRESIGRLQAERFMRLANQFKASTMRVVGRKRIFA